MTVRVIAAAVAALVLVSGSADAAQTRAAQPELAPELAVDTRFYAPPPNQGAEHQVDQLRAGQRPTAATGNALVDAFLWVKLPGESDGECYRWTAGPLDPARGMHDPAPGLWFDKQAAELARRAIPAFR